jgi:YVTN family beta-propeller protein
MQFIKPAVVLGLLISSLFANAEDRGKAYVSNQEGGVSIINLNTMETEGSIDIQAKNPRGIGVTEDGRFLITANKDNENLSVIDLKTNQFVKHIPVGKNPEFVRVYKGYVFVSTEPASSGKPPAAGQEDDDKDEPKIPARIAVVDLAKGKKIRDIIGGPETEGIEFSKSGKEIIVTNEADNTITVHNFSNGKLLKTISTKKYGERPRGIKVAPNGKYYVSTLEYGNSFIVLDNQFKHLKTIATGESPYGVSFDREGKRLFVATSKAKTLEVYDTTNFEKIKDIPTGRRCWHFSFSPDDKDILLACGKSDEVLVIDAEKLEVTKHIPHKEIPWGVVAYPKAMGTLDNVQ